MIERALHLAHRRPRPVLAIAVLAAAAGIWCASHLEVRNAFSDLLPDDDPGVLALRRTQGRMGDLSLLLIGVRSQDPAANLRYAEALTARLRSLPPSVCDTATYHLRDLRRFLEQNRWLYADISDLEAVRARLGGEIARRKNPLLVDLSSTEDRAREAETDAALERRLRRGSPLDSHFPGGVFSGQDGRMVWIAALPPSGVLSENGGAALLAAAERFIAELPPAHFHPTMEVRTAGPVVTAVRNRTSLERDVVRVTLICTALIISALALFFWSARAVALIAAPAALGTLLTYALTYVRLGYITTVTSFLVAFVMGNGTNYAIVFLARYDEVRHLGVGAPAAVADVTRALWRNTLMAAGATSVSYLSLAITSFRGFSQFGMMGAAGCLMSWLATFTVLPSLLITFDRQLGLRHTGRLTAAPLAALGRLLVRRPGALLLGSAAVTAVAAIGVGRFGADAFEYDFRKLSIQIERTEADRAWDRDLSRAFGRWPEPTVILADRSEDVPAIRQAIRRNDAATGGPPVIGSIVAAEDLLPGGDAIQRRKLTLLADIRRLVRDPLVAAASGDLGRRVAELEIPANLRTLSPLDLPALARRPFTEADGTVGRVLLIYPVEHGLSVWNGKDLLRIAGVLQHLRLPDGRVLETSGSAVVFASMIRSVVRDGPRATAVSLAAVCLLVLLRMRPRRASLLVLASLMAGIIWMIGTAGWLDVRITFLNFIALPFMFGVGAEYAINMVTELGRRSNADEALLSMGGPVALCSISAIVGYGSLLAARSGALRGLGAVAALGEAACLGAALVIAPAAIELHRRLRRPSPIAPGVPAS